VFFALGRRVVFGVIGFFALLGFISVPLGDKTGWGHLQLILASPATTHAVEEFRRSTAQARHGFVEWLTARLHPSSNPETNTAASATADASEGSVPPKTKAHHGLGPIPKIPTLSR
jgi:hypothetical protein